MIKEIMDYIYPKSVYRADIKTSIKKDMKSIIPKPEEQTGRGTDGKISPIQSLIHEKRISKFVKWD